MDRETVLRTAQERTLRLVRFMYCDNGGILRGKATHVSGLERRMAEGIGQSLAMQAFAAVDALAPVPGMGPVGEFRLVPDPSTFVILPHLPHTGMMLCDLLGQDQRPWAACPRTFLKRMLAEAATMGATVQATFEHEFYLARETPDGGYQPYDRSLCYSADGFDSTALIIDDLIVALEEIGVQVEQFMPELGPGQQEISIQRAEALRAADNALLVRQVVHSVARAHGVTASFAAKPFLDQAGSGAHIHFSLWAVPATPGVSGASGTYGDSSAPHAGQNLLYDPQGRGGLSPLAYHFIGGVLAHLPGLLALTCASPNSYRRLLPHFWSSAYTAYGFDNREGAIRVPSPYWGREAESTNLELKPSDHSGNPYLALGGLIAAGLDGVRRALDPGEPLDIDPGNLSDQERAQLGVTRLPQSLDAALDALEADATLLAALGPTLANAYVAVKRLESAYFADKSPEDEARQHVAKY
jgi:glutamine synthetase